MAEIRQIPIDGRRIAEAVKSVENKTIYTAGENVTIEGGVISASGGTGGIAALYRHCITLGGGNITFTFDFISKQETAIASVSAFMNVIDDSAYVGSGSISGETYAGTLTEIQRLSSTVLRVSGLRFTLATGTVETYIHNLLEETPIFFNDYVREIQ